MSDLAGARSRESDPRGALSGGAGGELLIPTIVLLVSAVKLWRR
jgi:hypothetical protein